MIVHLEHFDTHSSTNNIEIFEINDIICLNITIQIYYKLFTTLHIILKYIIDELHVNNMQQQKTLCIHTQSYMCIHTSRYQKLISGSASIRIYCKSLLRYMGRDTVGLFNSKINSSLRSCSGSNGHVINQQWHMRGRRNKGNAFKGLDGYH